MKSESSQLPIRCRAVAAVILAGRGKAARVLVLQRNKNTSRGLWSIVMGRIQDGELAADAIRREIAEETGITTATLYTSGCCDIFFNFRTDSIEMMPIFVVPLGKKPAITLDDEHLSYRWLSFAQATKILAYPGQRQALPEIRQDFIDQKPPAFRLVRDA